MPDYTKQNFTNNITILTAEHMNHIEEGIDANAKAINKLSDENVNLTNRVKTLEESTPSSASSLTIAQVNALNELFKLASYTASPTSAYNNFKSAFGITDNSGSTDEEETPTEKTLSSISATYSGGDVTVGTDVNSLSGIVVTATYSDETTSNVTDYTLSGEIIEGSNTITVTYQGLTTTFAVNGVADSSGDDWGTWTSGTAYDLTDKLMVGVNLDTLTGVETVNENDTATDYLYCFDADFIYHYASVGRIFFYDVNKNYISNAYKNESPSIKEVPENAVFFRLTVATKYFTNTTIIPIAKADVNCALGEQTLEWQTGGLTADGSVSGTSQSTTKPIPIAGASTLNMGITASYLGFYDENQNYICMKQNVATPVDLTVTPYVGASYVAICVFNHNKGNVVVTLE